MTERTAQVREPAMLAAIATLTAGLAVGCLLLTAALETRLRTERPVEAGAGPALELTLRRATALTVAGGSGGEFWLVTSAACEDCRAAEAAALAHAERLGAAAHVVLIEEAPQSGQAPSQDPCMAIVVGAARDDWCAGGLGPARPSLSLVRAALGSAPIEPPAVIWRGADGWRAGDAGDPRTFERIAVSAPRF